MVSHTHVGKQRDTGYKGLHIKDKILKNHYSIVNRPHESQADKLWLTLGMTLRGPVKKLECGPHWFSHTLHAKQISHT